MDERAKGGRKLSVNEVNNLMGGIRKKEIQRSLEPSKADDIFQRHAKELLALLDEKVDSVDLDGVEVYASKRPDRDNMFVRPREGFVPCGEFSRSWLLGKLAR